MKKKNYNVIGVMSGTSLDGVDCAYVKIAIIAAQSPDQTPIVKAEICIAETIPYPVSWQESLAIAHTFSKAALEDFNTAYTAYLARILNDFIEKNTIKSIDFVCSHGHTILHNPDDGFTLQIGNLSEIATLINRKVICDFRTQDVAMGGQGAPLVPIGDALLYSDYDYCLNLGGFANVSTAVDGARLAYDICPVNVVLNKYAQQLGAAYDDNGAFAKAGTVTIELLKKLNALPFYSKPAPKSLGIEWVHNHIFPLIESIKLLPHDIIATFTEHIAIQLATQFRTGSTVLVTGGGAYNGFLLERVYVNTIRRSESVKGVTLIVPDSKTVEFKEALVFALLGVLKEEGLPNCLASVTGASQSHSSGVIFLP